MLSPPAMVGRGAGRDLGSRARVLPEEAESVRVLVALLSPAAAPSPPLPRERGHPATAEGTQAVCRPAAFCKGPSWGWGHRLGTRAGHRHPHMASTCLAQGLQQWDCGGGNSSLILRAIPQQLAVHKFMFSVF